MGSDGKLRLGSVFAGDFRVIRALDEGGMGQVYLVEQLSTGEERALKVLKPNLLSDARSRLRFGQEATIGSHIASDHVVKVIAAGVDDEAGLPWIAMELLRGERLSDVMRERGAMAAEEVLELVRQLAHALGAAHDAGVVHQDVKPENVFVARARTANETTVVKLIDFGIAKVVAEFETSVMATAAMGSPLWMAPEQVRMEKIRPATDVWALGLLVFHLLTGRYYWKSVNAEGFARAEALLHEKLYEPMEPASRRAAAVGCEWPLPEGFDDWFRRATARAVTARFPTAREALSALESVLAPGARRARPWRRARLALATAAGAVLALGAVFATNVLDPGPAARLGSTPDLAPRLLRALPTPPTTALAPAPAPPDVLPDPPRATASAPVAPAPHTPRLARAHALPVAPAAVTSPAAPGATAPPEAPQPPRAVGYDFVRRDDPQVCSAPALPYAWQATPEWYVAGRRQLEIREHNVRHQEQLAARATAPGERERLEVSARHDREVLEALRDEFYNDTVVRQAELEREHVLRAARGAGCTSDPLHTENHQVYAIWCCP